MWQIYNILEHKQTFFKKNMNKISQNFLESVKSAKEKGLIKSERNLLIEGMGISPSTFANIRGGLADITAEQISLACKAVPELSTDYILLGEGEPLRDMRKELLQKAMSETSEQTILKLTEIIDRLLKNGLRM